MALKNDSETENKAAENGHTKSIPRFLLRIALAALIVVIAVTAVSLGVKVYGQVQEDNSIRQAQEYARENYYTYKGTQCWKGKVEIYFASNVSEERMREIISEVGGEPSENNQWKAGEYDKDYIWISIDVPEGEEISTIDALMEYSEVITAEGSGVVETN